MAKISERDRALHTRLTTAMEKNIIVVNTDIHRLGAPNSPVYDPWESVGPLLCMLLGSLAMLFSFPLLVGMVVATICLVASVMIYLFVLRPWQNRRVRHRALVMAMASPAQLDTLWAFGGVVLMLSDRPQARVTAPAGNWRNFILRHLPEGGFSSIDEEMSRSDFVALSSSGG